MVGQITCKPDANVWTVPHIIDLDNLYIRVGDTYYKLVKTEKPEIKFQADGETAAKP